MSDKDPVMKVWFYALALVLGLLTGYIDLHSVEVQLPALMLLVFTLFLGFAQPVRAWRWTLLVGLWVPGLYYAALLAGAKPVYESQTGSIFIALVPALIGAYLGALARRAVSPEVGERRNIEM